MEEVVSNSLFLIRVMSALNCPIIVTEQYPKFFGRTGFKIALLSSGTEIRLGRIAI
ncbi:hypothetical protein MHBO_001339 [Bonamia ostreae]|uniref:Uncharacterized protein n=1 Tax=Bonamia ostreae TaxID=126728 RepID=A0ABV2AJH7_9EUKA